MKKRNFAALLLLICCLSVGCSSVPKSLSAGDVDVNTILVRSDGSIQFSIVEDFDKPYYSKSELVEFIEAAVLEYNTSAGEDTVISESVGLKDGIANSVLTYQSIKDYSIFNDVDAELLSVTEAANHFQIPAAFVNADDSSSVSTEDVLKNKGYQVLILSEPMNVIVEGKIRYYSNAIMLNESMVQTSKEGITIIVYKP